MICCESSWAGTLESIFAVSVCNVGILSLLKVLVVELHLQSKKRNSERLSTAQVTFHQTITARFKTKKWCSQTTKLGVRDSATLTPIRLSRSYQDGFTGSVTKIHPSHVSMPFTSALTTTWSMSLSSQILARSTWEKFTCSARS